MQFCLDEPTWTVTMDPTYSDYSTGSLTPSVCIIGAGVSGLLAAIKLRTELGFTSVTIFDENEEIGGRWLSGYPGQSSSFLAHLCSYSFELKPDWPHNYASSKEMLDYLRAVAHKYGLYPLIKFNSQVKSLTWDAKTKKWNAIILNRKLTIMKYNSFDIVICAAGKFRQPIIPECFGAFKGQIVHTSQWDPAVDLEGKAVGVIGSGEVAIQLIPAIEPKVKVLHFYQKEPSWILPRAQFTVPKFCKRLFEKLHFLLVLFRWFLFAANEILCFPVFLKNSYFNDSARFTAQRYITKEIQKYDPMRWQLEPKYPFGYKPVLQSNDFYKKVKCGKVIMHHETITHVANSSVTTSVDGIQELDVLILAPEDDPQEFFGPMKIIDKFSQDLLSRWKNARVRIRTYFGFTTSVTPNLFFLKGPHSTILHNSPMFLIECQMSAIIRLLKEMLKRSAKVVEVEEFAEDEFLNDLESQVKRTIWFSKKVGYWFINGMGAVTALWPWTSVRYWCRTRSLDYSKFRFY